MALGVNIKRYRKRFGYSQQHLAHLTGIPQSLLWYYENDKKIPSAVNAYALAKVFGITVEELLLSEESKKLET